MFDIVLRTYPESNPWQNSDNPIMTAPAVVNQLNCEQLAFYNENGYLAVDRVATDYEVAEIRALYDRMFSSRTGRNAGDHFDLAGTDEEGKEPLLAQILQPSKYFPELKQTALYRNVGKLIRDLLGPEAELTGDHAINKSPRHGAETPWHQDEAYWDPDKDHCSISVWIPLQPATIRNGCMHFISCSHRLGVLEHRPIGNDPRVHGLEVVPGIFDFSGAMACELPAGGATFHGGRMLHFTPTNCTADYRRALIVIGGLPPVKRSTPRRFPWLERQNTARARRATTAS
ncbi:MAG: phytanoyl-CoA dioxygenase family protein [Chthoniobacterales bacterium]